MNKNPLIGNAAYQISNEGSVSNDYTTLNGKSYAVIHHIDQMEPFFMSIVSATDLWLFVSSNGGISAGRSNAGHAIFPYYTDDKITDTPEITGSKTILRVQKDGNSYLWEPFSDRYEGIYDIKRNLYKGVNGDCIVFEEVNDSLQMRFSYEWMISEGFGLVKRSSIQNQHSSLVVCQVLDGVQNLLPAGVNLGLQTNRSNLVNAYKRNELHETTGLGIFALSSNIVDRAEPSEAQLATTVWTDFRAKQNILLSNRQLKKFRIEGQVDQETDVKGERCAYFVNGSLEIKPGEENSWLTVIDLDQDHSAVASLIQELGTPSGFANKVMANVKTGESKLASLVGESDGLQLTADKNSVVRHFSNTVFNVMRGGIACNGYSVDSSDFRNFINSWNKGVYQNHQSMLEALPDIIAYQDLVQQCVSMEDADLQRLSLEYLPLTFSRRHGDPSRPWNVFNINLTRSDGSQIVGYEGNWRDIFQNWEALGLSFPHFIEGMITKFVNASTIDGYNPYRINEEGVDWEVEEPDDPWSYIGYWGDHQTIYLLKLLEIFDDHYPGKLKAMLNQQIYTFANVPYVIKEYEEIIKDPYDTITFNEEVHENVQKLVGKMGYDGKLILKDDGEVFKVSLLEKLLILVLTKLSNYVPGGGIWMNTQRPEWNDANNALVGYGISVVTLNYLRRFLKFFEGIILDAQQNQYSLSEEVVELLTNIQETFSNNSGILGSSVSDKDRKQVVDALGQAGSNYRQKAYTGFTGARSTVSKDQLLTLISSSLAHIDDSLRQNERADKLFHAYNLLNIKPDGMGVDYLYEMLEGQVAILSAGLLDTGQVVQLLDAMKNSLIYREDQYSYLLYPNRELPGFLERNILPKDKVESSSMLKKMLGSNDKALVTKDQSGAYHFNADFTNAKDLRNALDQLSETEYQQYVAQEGDYIMDLFEHVFNHKEFTGRSGTFFGYEGLGSIYWHMVSKLLLAVQENLVEAKSNGADAGLIGRLIDHYYEIRAGIGINKSAELYGGYPTDPYSHTPWHKGAQQPGMTGQVKEDILNRWAELGISVEDGQLIIDPFFLSDAEYLTEPAVLSVKDVKGENQQVDLPAGSLGFTYCQVPFVLVKNGTSRIEVLKRNGQTDAIEGNQLPKALSSEIFGRTGEVKRVIVHL